MNEYEKISYSPEEIGIFFDGFMPYNVKLKDVTWWKQVDRKMRSKTMNEHDYIKERLPEEMILGQLMEECAELAQAAHKIIRQRQGVNLPHGDHDFVADLNEEIADVMLCALLVENTDWNEIEKIMIEKYARWDKRLREEVEQRDNDSEDR